MENEWMPINSIPKNGALLDVMFSIATAEPGMAEFYAPGCTDKLSGRLPIISNVAYANGSFRPVTDADAVKQVENLAGGWGFVTGCLHGILSVTLTKWRYAESPPNE